MFKLVTRMGVLGMFAYMLFYKQWLFLTEVHLLLRHRENQPQIHLLVAQETSV